MCDNEITPLRLLANIQAKSHPALHPPPNDLTARVEVKALADTHSDTTRQTVVFTTELLLAVCVLVF